MKPFRRLFYLTICLTFILLAPPSDSQTPPEPLVQIVSGPGGLVHQNSVTFHFSEFVSSSDTSLPLFAYSLDDAPFQFTT
ncbi:MAG: hypothetical protein O7E52_00620, partial [Candidatus Poribacteria bacterium]|nr:hypothetical protein [Candidatus Poribacteria bacterium]